MENVNKTTLISDIKTVLSNAEEFLKTAASSTGEKATELREKAAASLKNASYAIADLQDSVVEKSKEVARATDDYVHENPWKSIGIAAGVGFVLGLLVSRK